MFILVLQQCHKENEDKWKRLSRQIADVILPMIAKQQVGKCVVVHVGDQPPLLTANLFVMKWSGNLDILVCCVLTDASRLSGGVGSVEHSV